MVDVPLSGAIDAQSLLRLLSNLLQQEATGSLKITGPAYHKQIYLRGGRVLFASSNDPRDQLGSILVESGKLTAEQLSDVQSRVDPAHPLARILADSGLVTQQELGDAARNKVERILRDVLQCMEGSYDFEDGVLPKGAIDLKLNTEHLLLSAVRGVSDRAYVLRHIEGLDVVLSPRPGRSARLSELNAVTDDLASRFDRRRTLQEAIRETRLDEFEGAKIACGLLLLGLLERSYEAPQAPSPFFVSDDQAAEEIDLGQTARQAVEEAAAFTGARQESTPVPISTPVPPPISRPVLPEIRPRGGGPTSPADASRLERSDAGWAPPSSEQPPSIASPMLPFLQPNPESEGKPVFPTIKPPSKSDLAALGSLLGREVAADPSPPRMTYSGTERLSRYGPQGPARRDEHDFRKGAVLALTAIGVIILAGAAVWRFGGFRPPDIVDTRNDAPETLPTLPPPTLAISSPVAPPSTLLETPNPAAAATPIVSTTPATTPGVASAQSLLQGGRIREAGRAFDAELRRSAGSHTIQLLVACSDETIHKALQAVGPDRLILVPVRFKGRDCHRMCWGLYADTQSAESARRSVPEYFIRGGVTPRVMRVGDVLE
ncbi:MAG: DUF4388 domain-containing protein [Vicinamibacteria bacterium]|nr:DUF4388 domain-containing protein [Vicinamibacteria bacterium]